MNTKILKQKILAELLSPTGGGRGWKHDEWKMVKLGEVLLQMEAKKPTGITFGYIDIDAIDNKKHIIKESKIIDTKNAPSRASRGIKYGDTLFSMVRPYLENIAFVENEFSECIASTGFFVCRPKEVIFPKYLYYLMLSPFVISGLNSFMKGDNSPSINNNNITSFEIPLPPLPIQKAIVAQIERLFAEIDRIESARQSLLKLVKLAKQKILSEFLIQNSKFKIQNSICNAKASNPKSEIVNQKSEILSQTDEWKTVKLGEVCEINQKNKLNDDLEVSFIPMTLIQDGFANKHTSEIKEWQDVKKGFTHFQEKDIGIAKITPCFENRKSLIFKNLKNGFGAGTTELHIIRPNNKIVLTEFVFWIIKTEEFISNGIKNFTGAVGQQRVGKNILADFDIPLPPLSIQRQIVEKIEKLFSEIEKIENTLKI